MNNLEGISFKEAINSKGLSYEEFRRILIPEFAKTWYAIFIRIFILLLILFLFLQIEIIYPNWYLISIPLFSILTGFMIASLNLFVHEAGHYYLYPDKKINDLLANIFLCSWTGIHISVYRKIHWKHHQLLSTPDDTENTYFNPLTPGFIFEGLSGIHLLRIILNKNNRLFLGKDLRKKSIMMLITGIIINSTILFLAFWFSYIQFAIVWFLAMLVFFPFFASIRQLIEHRDELAGADKNFYQVPQRKISRLFTNSLFSRYFGSAGFNKHMIHHWDPQLPFTSLNKAELFLADCERTGNIIVSSKTNYFTAFKNLWHISK